MDFHVIFSVDVVHGFANVEGDFIQTCLRVQFAIAVYAQVLLTREPLLDGEVNLRGLVG